MGAANMRFEGNRKQTSRKLHFLGTAAAIATGLLPLTAAAQMTAPTSDPLVADEAVNSADIIVTARKRSESVQKIPESIRAITSQDLQRLGADSLEGYAGVTPSLQLTGTRAATQVVIRGITAGPVNHDQSQIKETVGIYLDETPIAVQRYNPNLRLFDIEQIEVLRGPQGTLYGAGSMAGAIRMITKKPQAHSVEAEVEASAATVTHGSEDYSLDGMVNLPVVSDVLAVRAVGSYRRDAGYIDNVSLNIPDANSNDAYIGRVALRYTPESPFSFDTMLLWQDTKYRTQSTYVAEAGLLNSNAILLEPAHDRLFIASATARYDAGFGDITVVGSYLRKKYDYSMEVGSFPSFITGGHEDLGTVAYNYSSQRNYSVEARVASKPDSAIRWIVGAFYQHSQNAYGQDVTAPGVDALGGIDSTQFAAAPDQLYFSAIDIREKQLALFGEVNVPVTEQLTLSVGGRQFFAWQNSSVDFAGIFAFPNIGVARAKNEEDGFNPKVNVSYQIDNDRMVYVQASKGFRLGGTNEPVPQPLCTADLQARGFDAAPTSFKSDSLWNYEAGAKTSWLDRRLTVNASVYRVDWKSPQVTAQLACGFNVFVNAGGLRVYGAELETSVRPIDGLTLTAGGAYTDSKLTSDLPFVNGREGDHAPYTPRWTFNTSADYRQSLSDQLEAFAFVNYQHTGERNQNFNPIAPGNIVLPAYGSLNARIGLNSDHWSLELFGQNLTNSLGELNRRFTPFSFIPATLVTVVKPRTIGVKARYKL